MSSTHGCAWRSRFSAASCLLRPLTVSPRPKREWWKACSKPNELLPSLKRQRNVRSPVHTNDSSASCLRCSPVYILELGLAALMPRHPRRHQIRHEHAFKRRCTDASSISMDTGLIQKPSHTALSPGPG